MQKTREQILHILKTRGPSTVDELSEALELTSVTVRHHLEILRNQDLVDEPEPLRRDGPGRPQYLYRLAQGAEQIFPSGYDMLAAELLREINSFLSREEVDALADRIAQRIASQAYVSREMDFDTRLEAVVEFLNERGYMASVERDEKGKVLLHIYNCPYDSLTKRSGVPCDIDARLLSTLLSQKFSRVKHAAKGDQHCIYVIHEETD
ncbi:MAG: ArsR family transcriptional regulator [Anaerolineae bacterium]